MIQYRLYIAVSEQIDFPDFDILNNQNTSRRPCLRFERGRISVSGDENQFNVRRCFVQNIDCSVIHSLSSDEIKALCHYEWIISANDPSALTFRPSDDETLKDFVLTMTLAPPRTNVTQSIQYTGDHPIDVNLYLDPIQLDFTNEDTNRNRQVIAALSVANLQQQAIVLPPVVISAQPPHESGGKHIIDHRHFLNHFYQRVSSYCVGFENAPTIAELWSLAARPVFRDFFQEFGSVVTCTEDLSDLQDHRIYQYCRYQHSDFISEQVAMYRDQFIQDIWHDGDHNERNSKTKLFARQIKRHINHGLIPYCQEILTANLGDNTELIRNEYNLESSAIWLELNRRRDHALIAQRQLNGNNPQATEDECHNIVNSYNEYRNNLLKRWQEDFPYSYHFYRIFVRETLGLECDDLIEDICISSINSAKTLFAFLCEFITIQFPEENNLIIGNDAESFDVFFRSLICLMRLELPGRELPDSIPTYLQQWCDASNLFQSSTLNVNEEERSVFIESNTHNVIKSGRRSVLLGLLLPITWRLLSGVTVYNDKHSNARTGYYGSLY